MKETVFSGRRPYLSVEWSLVTVAARITVYFLFACAAHIFLLSIASVNAFCTMRTFIFIILFIY